MMEKHRPELERSMAELEARMQPVQAAIDVLAGLERDLKIRLDAVEAEVAECFDARIADLEHRKAAVVAECREVAAAKEKTLAAQRGVLEGRLAGMDVSCLHRSPEASSTLLLCTRWSGTLGLHPLILFSLAMVPLCGRVHPRFQNTFHRSHSSPSHHHHLLHHHHHYHHHHPPPPQQQQPPPPSLLLPPQQPPLIHLSSAIPPTFLPPTHPPHLGWCRHPCW
jgi:hypothetical protein